MGSYNKILTQVMVAVAVITSVVCLSSCSDEDLLQTASGEHTITLNITPVDNEETRSAVTSTTVSAENTIHRLAIAIVNPQSGNIIGGVREIEVSSQESTGTVSYSFTDADISEGDKVLIFANCPKGKFSKAGNYNDIKYGNYYLSADEALNQDGGSAASYSNLPMYGEATASFNGTNNLTADVFIYHMVTKVTLNSLTVDLRSGDTFTPEEMFMANVVDYAVLVAISDYENTGYSSGHPSVVEGESGKNNARPYLTTGKSSWTGTTDEAGAIKYTNNLPRFYVTPSNNNSDSKAGSATMLVIKGTYKEGGKGDGKTLYYSMFINYNNNTDKSADGHAATTLFPNANYVMDVTIKGVGMDSYSDASSVGVVSLKSQYRGFSATTTPVNIGDYLYNDGSWGPSGQGRMMINSSHYPVARIFSTTTSKIDQGHGWTHGYAVAINKCGAEMPWASTNALYGQHRVAISNSDYTSPARATDKSDWMNDLDGYTETIHITGATDYAKNSESTRKTMYPAVWYALHDGTNQVGLTEFNDYIDMKNRTNYNLWEESSDKRKTMGLNMTTGTNTSGWYLGSVGQYYLMFKNFSSLLSSGPYPYTEGIFTDDDVIRADGSASRWIIKDKVGSIPGNTCLTALSGHAGSFYCESTNDFFGERVGDNKGSFTSTYGDRPVIYWTSSEYDDGNVYQIRLVPSSYSYGESSYKENVGCIVIVATSKTASTQNIDCVGIRPVIAF